MKTPIDLMLDGVTWTPITEPPPADSNKPHATHYGSFDLAGTKIRCYQLSNGHRVIDADDVNGLFGELVTATVPNDGVTK